MGSKCVESVTYYLYANTAAAVKTPGDTVVF